MPILQRLRIIAVSVALVLAVPTLLRAQDPPGSRVLQGPIIGFVNDKTAGIRPILGRLGAATLGPSVLARAGLESVALAPDRDYALVVLALGRQVAIVRSLSTAPKAVVLDVPGRPARVAFSPSGDAVAFYYSDSARAEVLTGLPDSPSLAWTFDFAEMQSGLTALAVSDGGGAVLAAAAGEPATIWLAAPQKAQRFLYAASGSPSLTFLSQSEDLAIAETSTGNVVLVRDPKGEALLTKIGGLAEGVSQPVAIAATRDNRRILVANAEPAGVVSLGLSGQQAFKLTCSCTPTTLERMAGGAVFRLNEPGEGPMWLLDTATSTPRIVFVPDQTQLLRTTGRMPVPGRTGGER